MGKQCPTCHVTLDEDGVHRCQPWNDPSHLAEIETLARKLKEAEARAEELDRLVYVPGLWKCAKCKCTVVSTVLDANSGRHAADKEPQRCPNDCGPMWRVTEREGGNNAVDAMERLSDRAIAAESTSRRLVEENEKLRAAIYWRETHGRGPWTDGDMAIRQIIVDVCADTARARCAPAPSATEE